MEEKGVNEIYMRRRFCSCRPCLLGNTISSCERTPLAGEWIGPCNMWKRSYTVAGVKVQVKGNAEKTKEFLEFTAHEIENFTPKAENIPAWKDE